MADLARTAHVQRIETPPSAAPRRAVWAMFAVLIALMVMDFADRQIVVSLFPWLKREWQLSDVQLGALASMVAVIVAIATVPLSYVADRWGHVRSIFAMSLLWSGATIVCAVAPDYASLLAARGVVGLGAAAYGAVGAALIGTLFPERIRGTMIGLFLAGGVLGSVLGIGAGAALAQTWGWRSAFGIAGAPGIVLAFVLVAAARASGSYDQRRVGDGERTSMRHALGALIRTRTVVLASIGGGLQLLSASALYAWLPSYLHRVHGMPADRAGAWSSGIVLIGLAGIVACGSAADWLAVRNPRARLWVAVAAALVTAFFMLPAFALVPPGPVQLALIVVAAATVSASVGALAATVIGVVDPRLRATATSVLALMQNLLGLAAGPLVAGAISDAHGLAAALAATSLPCVGAAMCYLAAARSYPRDLERTRTWPPSMKPTRGLGANAAR